MRDLGSGVGWSISGRFPRLQYVIAPFFMLLLWWIRKRDQRWARKGFNRRWF
jgi:hypothetical protein